MVTRGTPTALLTQPDADVDEDGDFRGPGPYGPDGMDNGEVAVNGHSCQSQTCRQQVNLDMEKTVQMISTRT